MNISYKWLTDYLPQVKEMTPEQVADQLTAIGLEVGTVEQVDSIKGGLAGLVVGLVKSCTPHPNSDHLHVTTVDVGGSELLPIVCGAPNVAEGQYVIVATVGTTLYDEEGNPFVIKKSKLRGEASHGMICGEKEIGLGQDTSGIMVLKGTPTPGTPAAQLFGLESDYAIEVDITPNRIDGASHFGVARDLAAALSHRQGAAISAQLPEVPPIAIANPSSPHIQVSVEAPEEECPRYMGITLEGVTVAPSPEWMQERLKAIGLQPINNLVDISNYILHETGQPLHFFDADRTGEKVIIRHLAPETIFTALDGSEHKLDGSELMISDTAGHPLCMAGIYGGKDSGVTEQTVRLFIECATFGATVTRKAARKHGFSTDASFRFERGLSPLAPEYTLRRAVALVQELAGGTPVGKVVDCRQGTVESPRVALRFRRVADIVGCEIAPATIKRILESLDFEILSETAEAFELALPLYRTDVRREIDVIEELLRIYGYNEIPLSGYIRANLATPSSNDRDYHAEIKLSEQLVGAGYNEILCNSLTAERYYQGLEDYPTEQLARLLNPLSSELNVVRATLLFGGLEAIARNLHNKQTSVRFFEWGQTYRYRTEGEQVTDRYPEESWLALWNAGENGQDNWFTPSKKASFYELKADLENIFTRMGIAPSSLVTNEEPQDLFDKALVWRTRGGKLLARAGQVHSSIAKRHEIEIPVYYAEVDRTLLMKEGRKHRLEVSDINRMPVVKRDLALLVPEEVSFARIEQIATQTERKLLKRVLLFDVFTGGNVPAGKKSYAVRFWLQDASSTLTDKQIERTMQRLTEQLTKELGAELR